MRRFVWLLVVLPLALIMVAFAIANRHPVLVSTDPLPFAIEVPLFAVAYVAVLLGLLVGGFVAWWRAGRTRRVARERRRTVQRLEAELKAARAQAAAGQDTVRTPAPPVTPAP